MQCCKIDSPISARDIEFDSRVDFQFLRKLFLSLMFYLAVFIRFLLCFGRTWCFQTSRPTLAVATYHRTLSWGWGRRGECVCVCVCVWGGLWWWVLPRLRGFWKNIRPFISRLSFLLKWRLARAHWFHSLGQDQSTVAQRAETTGVVVVVVVVVVAKLTSTPYNRHALIAFREWQWY